MSDLKKKRGVWAFTGEIGVGKTLAALGVGVNPKNIALFNFDAKHPDFPVEEFGFYRAYTSLLDPEKNGGKLNVANEVLSDLEKIPANIELIVFDVFELFGDSLRDYVMKNSGKLNVEWSAMGKFAVMQKINYAKTLQSVVLEKATQKAGVVIVTTHLKDTYEDNLRTGTKEPAVPDAVKKVVRGFFWLRTNSEHPMPLALTVKNVSSVELDKKTFRMRPVNVFPPRLSHKAIKRSGAISIWDVIDHYLENPVGTKDLEEYERATEFEEGMISGTMTEEQKQALNERRQLMLQQEEVEMSSAIKALLNEDVEPKHVVEQLKADFPNISVVDVMKARK